MQTPLTFFFAFVAVLVLIGAVAWLVRRFAGNRLGGSANRGRMPRLAVIDAAAVDGRRRLVLVRRDNVEHLLMIGGPSDIVVEPNIVRAMPSRDQAPARPSLGAQAPDAVTWNEDNRLEAPEPALPPPPRPSRPSFADELRRTPPPVQPEHRHDPLATISSEPVTRPEPRPDLRAEPPARPPLRGEPQMPRPPIRGNDAPPPEAPPPPPSPRAPELGSPAAPPASADQNLAEMAKRLEAALRRPSTPEARAATPAPEAPPVQPRPAPRINVSTAPAESSAPAVTPPNPPKGEFENLEDEMASLLGRPKTPS